jgi:hypothetical protein
MTSFRNNSTPKNFIRWFVLGLLAAMILGLSGCAAQETESQADGDEQTMDTITTASGLQYQDLVVGSGAEAKAGDTVSVHYTGWLEDGTKFDSSLDRNQPLTFTLGTGGVIQGWDEGVAGMQMGGKHQFDFGEVKMTQAIHGSTYEIEGEALTLGLAAGIVFSVDGQTIYHAGDTALFTDMKLIGAYKMIDVAFLPIGDNFTMGPEDATSAASYVQAKKVVPIHYDTFPLIKQNAEEFCISLPENQGLSLKVGEVFDVSYV